MIRCVSRRSTFTVGVPGIMMNRVSSLKRLVGAVLLAGMATAQAASLLVNGDFSAGTLDGWTSYANEGGTIGTPAVVLAEVVDGAVSLAARLKAGQAVYASGPLGGGLAQHFTVSTDGTYQVYADILSTGNTAFHNADGGTFSLLIDGRVVASHAFGDIAVYTLERAGLRALVSLEAGAHDIRLQAERAFFTGNDTPSQYFDNAGVTAGVPEASPHVLVLAGLAMLGGMRTWRRRLAK